MLVHALCKTDRRHSTVHLRIDMAVAFFDGWLYIFQQRLQLACSVVVHLILDVEILDGCFVGTCWHHFDSKSFDYLQCTRLARTRPCRRLILRKNDIGVEAAGAPSYA